MPSDKNHGDPGFWVFTYKQSGHKRNIKNAYIPKSSHLEFLSVCISYGAIIQVFAV